MQSKTIRAALAAFSTFAVVACAYWGKPKAEIPVANVDAVAQGNADTLVIVLPGLGDTLGVLKRSGIVETIQHSMPSAQVALVELSLPYYMEGRAVQRLRDEVLEPARARGVREIFLAGASMGGMGALMYERTYPNEVRGLILLAPFMGDEALVNEIESAGGLANWNAGPTPDAITRDNTPREEWRAVQSWLNNKERARNVWLVCGQDDRFHPAARLIASALPPQHFIAPPGGHGWKVWKEGAAQVFSAIAAEGE